jgi:hypothetical protein
MGQSNAKNIPAVALDECEMQGEQPAKLTCGKHLDSGDE